MDTSETYIKMCDCEEIQEQRPRDFLYKEFFALVEGNSVWLPRQDQLQEMKPISLTDGVEGFFRFTQLSYMDTGIKALWWFESMEQLWFAFVMKEKFGKVWAGEWYKPESQKIPVWDGENWVNA